MSSYIGDPNKWCTKFSRRYPNHLRVMILKKVGYMLFWFHYNDLYRYDYET